MGHGPPFLHLLYRIPSSPSPPHTHGYSEYAVECACGETVSCLVSPPSLTSGSKKQTTKPLMEEEQLR